MRTSTSLRLNLIEFIIIQQIGYISMEYLPEDATLNTIDLATKYGHPPTQYDVVTEDGYILTLYRLPGTDSIPILLSHGIYDSSDTWLIRGEGSLAITLANDGCDVWLSNSRGNRYSRRHEHLNPDSDPEFWQFSFHEMGYYDLPAIIEKILDETGATSLTAIGHSQGNTIYYVLGSCRTEYNSKINVMISLAPIAYLSNSSGTVTTLMRLYLAIIELFRTLGIHEFLGDKGPFSKIFRALCSDPERSYLLCVDGIIFPLSGFDPAQLEPEFFPVILSHFPAGSSSMCLLHYLQVGRRNVFAQYDYGQEINQKVYNTSEPPVYQLDQITMRIAMLAASNDYLSSIPDVEKLRGQLSNVVYYLVNPYPLFNHIDYIWGKNMDDYLYPYVYKVLSSYNHF